MKNLLSRSIFRTLEIDKFICRFVLALLVILAAPQELLGRIHIDINAPSIQKIKIAIPDFENQSKGSVHPELSSSLPEVISNDLDLSGYFTSMDKTSFLAPKEPSPVLEGAPLREWSIIGADLLLKAEYNCIGRSLEAEVRLFDVYRGRQLMGKRYLGKIKDPRSLMHRVGNDILFLLTGSKGMFNSKIAFVGTATGHKEIYWCDYDGHALKQMTYDKSIALLPRWSPTGEKILFNSYREGGPNLYLKHAASGRLKKLSARKGLNIGATWAPDEERLALTLSHKGNPDIYFIDLTGKIIKRIVNHWGIDVSPFFSPDGKKLAFVSNRSGSPQIYVIDLLTNKTNRLTFPTEAFQGKYNTSPNWSTRNRIAFTGMNNGYFNIFVIDADGRNLRQLTSNAGNNEDPCWSPDGRHIVFSSNRDGRYHLYIMTETGQNQKKITPFKGEQTAPTWVLKHKGG